MIKILPIVILSSWLLRYSALCQWSTLDAQFNRTPLTISFIKFNNLKFIWKLPTKTCSAQQPTHLLPYVSLPSSHSIAPSLCAYRCFADTRQLITITVQVYTRPSQCQLYNALPSCRRNGSSVPDLVMTVSFLQPPKYGLVDPFLSSTFRKPTKCSPESIL